MFVAKEELRQRAGEFGFADTGRAEEDERTARAIRVLQTGPGTANSPGDGRDRILLTDDPLMEFFLHTQELFGFGLGELGHGNASPHGEHFGDGLFIDFVEEVNAGGLPLNFFCPFALEEFFLLITKVGGSFELLVLDRCFLVLTDLGDFVFQLAVVRRGLHPLDAQAGTGFVDQVDRLVRQLAISDIPIGHIRRGDQGLVGDGDAVVGFVALAQAFQDLDGMGDRGLLDLDGLESALQSSVLFQVFAVFLGGRGADGLELAAGEHRLEDAGGVDRALRGTGTDEGMDFVDEQDDVATGLDFFQDLLQALFEITAVSRASHEGSEVKRVHLLVLDRVWHVVGDDALRQAFHNGGFADARLADQHRIVFGATRQHLHDALDFLLATDNGIELSFTSERRQVAAELIEYE